MTQTRGFRTATRRYKRLFWPMIAIYVVATIAIALIVDKDTAPLWLNASCALAITLPLFGILYAMRRLTEETDEYTRMRQMKAMRDGGLITAGAMFLVGLLQMFNVVGAIDIFWFGSFFLLAYGLSYSTDCFGRTV